MPAQYRVRCDDRPQLPQYPLAKPLTLGCQAPTLVISEAEPLATLEFLKNANLLLKELDPLPLLLVQPPGDRKEQHSHW